METSDEKSVRELFLKYKGLAGDSLLPDELLTLTSSFLPWQSSSIRAQALLYLAKFTSDVRQKYSDSEYATTFLVRIFAPPSVTPLADTNEPATLAGLSFLVALFQVDWTSASAILLQDGVLDSVLESLDIYPSSNYIPVAVASLLSQASGHQECRPLLADPRITEWLGKSTEQLANHALRAAATVAFIKLSKGSEIDARRNMTDGITTASLGQPSHTRDTGTDDRLIHLLKDLVISNERSTSSMMNAVEGLAYLTIQPSIQEAVSSDPILLKRLFSLVTQDLTPRSFPASHADRDTKASEADVAMNYGIATIISNLCGYKPPLSEEERQIERLRRMTSAPGEGGKLSARPDESDAVEDNSHARVRGERLMQAGVVGALTAIIKGLGTSQSGRKGTSPTRRTVAKAFLSLAEEKINRGKILQEGGAKALMTIINVTTADIQPIPEDGQQYVNSIDPSDLLAIQALAKLSITSPPTAVFGPAKDSYIGAIRPFALLLAHISASLLQRFEAIMALTNIASVSPEAAERVCVFRFFPEKNQKLSTVGDITKRAESLLLDENTMLRRAAMELICNLVGGSEGAFDYFGGATSANVKSRLRILAALADVEDLQTRSAASGALAIVTSSQAACKTLLELEKERHSVLSVLVELISPEIAREYRNEDQEDEIDEDARPGQNSTTDPGLVHRGVVCVRNIFHAITGDDRRLLSEEAGKRGLTKALIALIKSERAGSMDDIVLKPAAEVVRWIAESKLSL